MKEFAEIIFNILGTTNQPNPSGKDFLKFLEVYNNVSLCKKYIKQDITYFTNLFKDNPHLIEFSFTVSCCIYEGDYSLTDFSIKQEGHDSVLVCENNLSHFILSHWHSLEDVVVINRHTYLSHFENIIEPEKEEIFNMVENFEKNKLETVIDKANVSTKKYSI